MQSWEIEVREKRHRVEFGVNEATGRRFVRLDARMAAPPFTEAERDIELDIDGEQWVARVRGNSCTLEKIADAVRPAPVGRMTVATAGLERIVVCDDAIVAITVLGEGMLAAHVAGGVVGGMLFDKLRGMNTAGMPGTMVRDPAWVGDTLDWASGLEFNVVMMRDRTPAYFTFLEEVMRRLASGATLGAAWKEAKDASPGNDVVVLSGPTDVIFVPKL